MKESERNYKRIVIKIGSSLFYREKNKLDLGRVEDFVHQVSILLKDKKEIFLVSSGAIALGMSLLKWESRPKELAKLQAAASLGQSELMNVYRENFKKRGILCSQVLLTWEDFVSRSRYLNAKNTLLSAAGLNLVPVINENDTVSTDEIKFGDNDQLSALVASMVAADLLIILSDVDGLLAKDKKTVVRKVLAIDREITALATSTDKSTSVGGMITKIKAAKISVDSGIPCVIANGRAKDIILTLAENPQSAGTIFLTEKSGLNARERWMAFSAKPKGKISVDDGAKKALLNKKSLLAVGIVAVQGNFDAGDVVSIVDKEAVEFARGKTAVSVKVLEKVKGTHFEKEAIHRDNIVIL